MTNENIKDLRSKILQGIDLAFARLLIEKQKEDGYLVFSRKGEIIKVKARDLVKKFNTHL